MQARGVDTSQQACGDIAHISLYPCNLPGKEQIRAVPVLKCGAKKFWRSYKCVPMHLPITQELRILQAGDESQDALLFRKLEVGLETNQIIKATCQVILPQLHDSIRTFTCARISQTNRAHGAKRQRIHSTVGNNLDRQTTFEEMPGFYATLDGIFKRT